VVFVVQHTKISSYKDLIVWRKSMELVKAVYELTDQLPSDERFGLISQMRRSAVSIPSNIAEGRRRGTRKDFLSFLRIAYGSGAELETQINILKILPKTAFLNTENTEVLLIEIMKMLNAMLQKMNPQN